MNIETRQGTSVPRAELFMFPPLALGRRDTEESRKPVVLLEQ